MKKTFEIQQLVRASLLIALGILLPQAFHGIKEAGPIFLPMHIPVLLGGFFVNPIIALLIGVITPILSHLITGMPPIPFLYVMMLELGAYGFFTSLLYKHTKKNVYLSLVLSMLIGRVVNIVGNYVVLHMILGRPFKLPVVATGLFVKGLPGIAIQLVLIPLIVFGVNRALKGRVGRFEG